MEFLGIEKKHLHLLKEADDAIMEVLFACYWSAGVFFSG